MPYVQHDEPLGYAFEREVWGKTGEGMQWPDKTLNYKVALKEAMDDQGEWDPDIPSTKIVRLLIESIKADLEKRGIQDASIKVYRTVGNLQADLVHGVDGVIVINNHIITVDTTANPNKTDYKTDVLFKKNDATVGRIHIVAEAIMKKYLELAKVSEILDELFNSSGTDGP